jgi:DNA-binding LytR/AlgR family response regulator
VLNGNQFGTRHDAKQLGDTSDRLTDRLEHLIVTRTSGSLARRTTRIRTVVIEDQIVARDPLVEMLATESDAGDAPAASGRLMVKSGGRVILLPLDDLDAVESEGNYVRLHSWGRSYLVRDTMAAIEARLGSERFCRIHRGWIVNLDRVCEVATRPNGEQELVMRDGRRIRVGRAYREVVQARLKGDTSTKH